METSFMYHCLGIRKQECIRTRYEGGRVIFEIITRDDRLYCGSSDKLVGAVPVQIATLCVVGRLVSDICGAFGCIIMQKV